MVDGVFDPLHYGHILHDLLDTTFFAAVFDRGVRANNTTVDGEPTHIDGALGVPTIAIHLGFPADSSRALGENVTVVTQRQPFDDPPLTSPDQVFRAVEAVLVAT